MMRRPWGCRLVAAAVVAAFGSHPPAFAQPPEAKQSPREVIVEDQDNPEEAGTPTYVSTRKLDGSTTLGVLSNGLTVIVQENHAAPLATVRCYVKNTGSIYETRWLGAGLSHLCEHLCAGGTTSKRTEEEVSALIDSFGGATNAYTSTDVTAYFVNCPSKQVETAIELIGDSMQRIVFDESEFNREHGVVQQELHDGEADRGRVQYQMLKESLYSEHPMRHPVIGYLDPLQKLKREDVVAFYKERYVPNNQVFVVVGDVNTKDTLDLVAKAWHGTGRGRETLIPLGVEPLQTGPRESVRIMDGETIDFAAAWPTVELSHPDLYALDVASYILTQGESSRLSRKLVQADGVALSVSSSSYTPAMAPGFFAVTASTDPKNFEAAWNGVLAEVERLKTEPIGEHELNRAKKQKAAELVFGKQSIEDAAESLGGNFISTGNPLFDKEYVENIQKVTAEQIQNVAKKYFVASRLNKTVIGPEGSAVEAATEVAAAKETPITKHILPNGVRVLLKRQPQLPMVTIQCYTLGAGLVETPEQAGVGSLVAAMLDQGTSNHSADQIAEYFDGIGGQLSISAGRSTLYANATVLSEDFKPAAGVLADVMLNPTFPEDRFEQQKRRQIGGLAAKAADAHSELMDFFADSLPKTTPYSIAPKKETIGKLTVADLKKYHEQFIVPSNMVVSIFGDVDPEVALKTAEELFGKAKPSKETPKINFDRDNTQPNLVAKHKQNAKDAGMVLVAYPISSVRAPEEQAALTILDTIMSGYSYPGGWLHEELRGEKLVYMVHATPLNGPAPGYFIIMAQTRPETVDEVVRRIMKNVEKAKAGSFSAEDVEGAKNTIVALRGQERDTISSQAQQASLDELYGLGYDFEAGFEDRIRAVTLEQVQAIAKKYLTTPVVVTTSPLKRIASNGVTSPDRQEKQEKAE